MTETLPDDLRSFVTFALAMKPDVRLQRQPDAAGPSLTLTISATESESGTQDEAKYASLAPLMERYRPLRPYLQAVLDSEESVVTCKPITSFKPGVDYRLIRISQAQFEVAKEVASRLDLIHVLHSAGYSSEASREHDKLHEYLADRRQALIGDFKGVTLSGATATYGADRLAAMDGDCSGAVIFVVIEIFIA